MQFPYLQPFKTKAGQVKAFGGYNHRPAIGEGEWFDMENLSARGFPLCSPRLPRGAVAGTPFESGGQMIAKNCLWVVKGRNLVGFDPVLGLDVHTFEKVFDETPQLVSFSSYIVDMKNGRWFSALPDDSGHYNTGLFSYSAYGTGNTFGVYLCDEKGDYLEENHFGASPPEDCVGGMLWFDTTTAPGMLKRYYEDSASFVEEPCYLRVSMDADFGYMATGDVVELTLPCPVDEDGVSYGIVDPHLPRKVVNKGVNANGTNFVVVEGTLNLCMGYSYSDGVLSLEKATTQTQGLTLQGDTCLVENPLPILDFVVEANNRLWGCRYGRNRKGDMVNEIYASALGSFRVWEKFEGIADDSYALSCGTDGPFTGAVTYNGQPLFFKENALHRVYGTFPFSVTPIACNGVQWGSEQSLAVVNNLLFYKSNAGICTYNGSLPTLLELPFGGVSYGNALGAGNETQYYLSMRDPAGESVLFVYDTATGLLMKESGLNLTHLTAFGEDIFATLQTDEGKTLLCLTGAKGCVPPAEDKVSWFAQSGLLGMNRTGTEYIQGLELALTLPLGSTLQVLVEYDSDGVFHTLGSISGGETRHITLPLRLRRCDHFVLRLEGEGEFTLHALTTTLREGGNAPCI